jgi:hypothetical protein
MIRTEDIKSFARQTLGCACPEEVFKRIDCQSNIKLNDNILLSSKINVGNKLLIYVVEINDQDSMKHTLSFLLNIGKKERDSSGFNRFRLVLATDKLDEIKEVADVTFKTIDKDDRIHLHVISKKDIPIFSNESLC